MSFIDYFLSLKKIKSIQLNTAVLFLFFFSFLIALISHVIFSVGINDDGADILFHVFLNEGSFFYMEFSRKIFHFLYQLPFILYIKIFPDHPLSLVTMIWSFSLIWIHFFSITGCYFILPKRKKRLIFFPLFAFATGPLIALSLSISVSLVVFSYIWLTAFVIHYSNLSLIRHKFLFILTPVPLFLSHELMSYMAWPLIYLCLLKIKTEHSAINKKLIHFVIEILTLIGLVSILFLIHPYNINYRNNFILDLFKLKFFIDNEIIDPACVLAFLILIFPICSFINNRYLKSFFYAIILCSAITAVTPFHDFFHGVFSIGRENSARVWVACIALPLSLLLWLLFENNQFKLQKPFLLSLLFAIISLTFWRVGSDYRFYQYQTQFSEKISNCKGLISWNEVKNKSFNPSFLKNFHRWYSVSHASIFYPRSYSIKTLIKTEFDGKCISFCDVFLPKLYRFNTQPLMQNKDQSGCLY